MLEKSEELYYIKASVEDYARFDLNEYYRDKHLHIGDGNKICDIILRLTEYISTLEARVKELESK